jgi:hypothetical protein
MRVIKQRTVIGALFFKPSMLLLSAMKKFRKINFFIMPLTSYNSYQIYL